MFYKFVSNFTNKLVKQLLSMTVVGLMLVKEKEVSSLKILILATLNDVNRTKNLALLQIINVMMLEINNKSPKLQILRHIFKRHFQPLAIDSILLKFAKTLLIALGTLFSSENGLSVYKIKLSHFPLCNQL